MKRILSMIRYVSEVVQAITKGAEVAAESWPTNNPFKSSAVSDSKVPEQQSTTSKPALSTAD